MCSEIGFKDNMAQTNAENLIPKIFQRLINRFTFKHRNDYDCIQKPTEKLSKSSLRPLTIFVTNE